MMMPFPCLTWWRGLIGALAKWNIYRSAAAQHGVYGGPRLRPWNIIWFAALDCFGNILRFATPRTPPLWQRGFFLVNCFVLRRFLASMRSRVVKTFRWRTSQIETVSQTDVLAGVNSLLDRCVAQILYSDCLRISGVDVD